MIDIIGLTREFKEANKGKLLSGDTKLNIPGAAIKKGKLLVPNVFQVQIGKQHRKKKENNVIGVGIASSQVIKKLLVIRANAPDASTKSSISQLSDNIFGTDGDPHNLKSQYAACSYDSLLFEPVSGNMNGETITAGVGEVTLSIDVTGKDKNVVKQAMLDAAAEKYGNLSSKVNSGELDHVMLCIPPGTGGWVAYAYVNSWLSVYNDHWCDSLSAGIHEVGHNLGLAHSGESATYDDQSGLMGYSYNQDDGPLMCFNGVKGWQLGWYPNGQDIITPLQSNSEKAFFEGRLIGVAEYNLLDTTTADKVIVQITGYDSDYYVSFNSKKGINSGTQEGGNQVLVHSRPTGENYETSTLKAKLSSGQEYTIEGSNTIVRVEEIDTTSTPSYSKVFIGNTACSSDSDCDLGEFCTEYSCDVSTGICSSFQDCSQCGGNVDVEIMTDKYGSETTWEVVNIDDGMSALDGGSYSSNSLTTAGSCLGFGNYEFRIYDSYGDGICCSYGNGYYKLLLDDKVLKEGGSFGSSEFTPFEIIQNDSSPTKAPTTLPPTSSPTNAPTLPPTPNPTIKVTTSPTKAPTTLPPTPNPTIVPTTFAPTQGGSCAKEDESSKECGAKQSSNNPDTCCPGVICNVNNRCVKEENYGCSGVNTIAKECGSTWIRAAPVCCPGFVCNFDSRKCVLP